MESLSDSVVGDIYIQESNTMYTGQIFYQGNSITVEEAVSLNLIVVDESGNIWLTADSSHQVKISGDLRLS